MAIATARSSSRRRAASATRSAAPVDPPLSLAGAQGLRVRCTYTNTSNEAVGWGTNSADEMCTMLAYVTGPNQLGGTAGTIEETVTLESGTVQQRSGCFAVGARGRQP